MPTTPTVAPALERIVEALDEQGWTIHQTSNEKALRAYHGMGRELVVYLAHGGKPYGFEAVTHGAQTRLGNIPWLTENIIAVIEGKYSVQVAAQFALVVDGEPMGYFDSPSELGQAVISAYANGATEVQIVRAK